MKEQIATFVAGLFFAGVFRLSLGRLILREEGSWCFRFSRFDTEDAAVLARVNEAYELGYKEGIRRQALKEET